MLHRRKWLWMYYKMIILSSNTQTFFLLQFVLKYAAFKDHYPRVFCVWKMELSRRDFRVMVFYDYMKGLHQEQHLENVKHLFGKNASSRTQVFWWFCEFRRGRRSFDDAHRCGTFEHADSCMEVINVRFQFHSFIHSFIHSFFLSFFHSFIHSFSHSLSHSFIHSFILSFIHSLIRSFIHLFIHSLIRSFIHLFIHSFILSFVHSFVHSFIHSFSHSFIHSFILSFVHSFIHSFILSFILSFVHAFIHSFIHSFIQGAHVNILNMVFVSTFHILVSIHSMELSWILTYSGLRKRAPLIALGAHGQEIP